MATYIENLTSRRNQIATELAAMADAQAAGSRPNVRTADGGTTIDHQQYKMNLYKELESLEKLILSYEMSGGDGTDTDISGLEVVTYADS